jgi:bifunctional DNA-binding transcriptional regulator/antitoxin component of YhaV-PrlF toxin-antitoxin module
MARINEYKANGGTFADVEEAISALENFLEEVQKTEDDSSKKLDKARRYRSNVSGLKDCFLDTINYFTGHWRDLGLDNSFIQVSEEIQPDRFAETVMFRHPVYEHIWLTDPKGKDVGEELLPFLTYNLEYQKQQDKVTVLVERTDTKLNLPELKTSVKTAREDIELVKKETELAGTVCNAAKDVMDKLTEELRRFCDGERLTLESSASTDISKSPKKRAKSKGSAGADDEEAEIVDIEDIDDTEFNLSEDDTSRGL